jgi:class 3 adenylate cyclase
MSTDREDAKREKNYDEAWTVTFLQGHPDLMGLREDFRKMRATRRCRLCKAPLDGDGPLQGREPSSRNRYDCRLCDKWIEDHHPGCVTSDFTLISADIRGSVALARSMKSNEFQQSYSDPFFLAAIQALNDTDGYILGFRGDECRGMYPHGFSRGDHVRKAVEGARRLLQDIPPKTPDGMLIPIGIGVYTGDVTIGTQPRTGVFQRVDIIGDGVNTCSRISGKAGPGEALISEQVCKEIGLSIHKLEKRLLTLKGIKETIPVYVITALSEIEHFPIKPS